MSSLIDIYKRFATHESCVKHLELVRWKGQPICPFCGGTKVAKKTEAAQQSRHQCWACSKSFSVTVGTIFHNTHVDLQKWFLLISLMFSAKKGLSAMQAARDLEMRRPTVWKMMHKIRAAMQDDGVLLSGIIEMDETYVGGKPRKKGRKDDNDPKGGDTSKRGRGTDKIPVVGAIERDGKVKTKAVDKTELASDEMKALFMRFVDAKTSVLNTDEYAGYNCKKLFCGAVQDFRIFFGDPHLQAVLTLVPGDIGLGCRSLIADSSAKLLFLCQASVLTNLF